MALRTTRRDASGTAMTATAIALGGLLCFAAPAMASPCDEARKALTLVHFETGQTDIPRAAIPKLEQFASTAKYKDSVCIRGQVDAQGGDAPKNRQIARSRALNIKLFLTSRGVREEIIEIQTQDQGFTLFGMLDPDQPADRRVRLTHE